MRQPKKRTRRSRSKYPALDPLLNLKTRCEEIADLATYAHKLSEKDREWLNAFAEGYINASRHSPLFKDDKKSWKEHEDRNNSRNRCIMTRSKAQGKMRMFSEMRNQESPYEGEDKMIYNVDNKEKKKD